MSERGGVRLHCDNERRASLDAGLASAFGENDAVVIGSHSVLKSLGKTIHFPRVALREPEEEGADPIQRPDSPEMPESRPDSATMKRQWH